MSAVAGPYWVRTATNGKHHVCGRHGETVRVYPADSIAMATADCKRLQAGYTAAEKRIRDAAPELVEALQKAIGWFEQYAAEHYAKAKNAPDFREQHGREVKGKTNADRAAELRTALSKAIGNDGAAS